MGRHEILAMAAVAMVLAGLGCARDLARASSGVIGCAPEDIAVDDVSVGWSETSWAASCRGTTFRCAGERSPWCTPSVAPQPGPAAAREASASPPAPLEVPAAGESPAQSSAEPSTSASSTEAAQPDPGSTEIVPAHPIHPIPEGFTDAPH